MSKCCDTSKSDDGKTVAVTVEISQETMRKATQSWIASDNSESIRDHLLDYVEVSPVFYIDGESVE